jgi:choline dehydrogenase-like flavoprotein
VTGAIIDLSAEQATPKTISADVCIIGSGCGGATAARVLAEAGRDVVVLEEGGDFPAERFTQRDGEMYDQLYMERGGRASSDLSVSVLQGRVLGGGGIINACDVVPIPEAVLEHWAKRHGLHDFRPEAVAPHAKLALEDLSAGPIPEAQVNAANRLLRSGTEARGLRGELMLHNRVGCAGMGTCLIGCPVDAKRNPRTVAIPAALQAGARFYVRARARRIEGANNELKRIAVRILDQRGHRERGELTVRAPIVIVAANAIGSAELLLRSAIGNAHVGRHLMLQPQLPVTAVFDQRVEAFRGIPQAYAVTEFERHDDPKHGLWGFRIEAIMGTPGMVGSLLPFSGLEGKSAMALYDKIAASLLLVPDAPSGTVRIGSNGRLRIDYIQREDHRARLRQAVREAARIYLAAGARRVIVPTVPALVIETERDLGRVDSLELAPASAPLLSAHQQGTLRFAGSSRDGAADPSGRIYGTRGVYVFDSSGFPSSASSHTMAPIIAISRYLSARLLAS